MSIIIQLPRDVNRFCRACMTLTDDKPSFDNNLMEEEKITELNKMFSSVSPEDGLPETLCTLCMDQLTLAYTFINQCKDVEIKLRDLLLMADKSVEETAPELENNETYTCETCFTTCASYYDLSMHMITHNMSKTLYERFYETRQEQKDVLTIALDKSVLDLVTARKSNNQRVLSDNKKGETAMKRGIQCKLCKKELPNRKQLISHICEPVNDKRIITQSNSSFTTCCLCDRSFPDSSRLSIHFLQHGLAATSMTEACVEAEFFFCEICGETFKTQSLADGHTTTQHAEKFNWLCSKCPDMFDKELEMMQHDSVHWKGEDEEMSGNYPCFLCNGLFLLKSALTKHLIEHLMKKYTCKKCPSMFCTQYAYFAHSKTHTTYQYVCNTCGKFLSTKSALKSHIIGVHSIELNHVCNVCGKRFAMPSRLKTHSEIHSSNKKYVCSYCGYSTHKAGDLQIHIRTHTSERPYKCTFGKCTASFKTSSHLCEHVRRHLQIRRFKCSICHMGFSTNNGLKIHHMQHTGEKPHSCMVCHQKFRRKYHVKVHMKQHIPDKAQK